MEASRKQENLFIVIGAGMAITMAIFTRAFSVKMSLLHIPLAFSYNRKEEIITSIFIE